MTRPSLGVIVSPVLCRRTSFWVSVAIPAVTHSEQALAVTLNHNQVFSLEQKEYCSGCYCQTAKVSIMKKGARQNDFNFPPMLKYD